jgi:hypothetical protein
VKEIDLAVEMGFDVQVICFQFDNWSSSLHDDIKNKYPGVYFLEIPAGRNPIFSWLWSVILEKTARVCLQFGIKHLNVLSAAISRRSILLLQKSKRLKDADWVIGHNPGALYPAYIIGKSMKAKIGFDMEDYHPGEGNDKLFHQSILRMMNIILPKLNYVSFASTAILEETEKHVEFTRLTDRVTLLNGFKKNEFKIHDDSELSGPLKLVWFSQYISYKRGLEQVLSSLHSFDGRIELHLYGSMDTQFEKEIINSNPFVKYHGVLNQTDLNLSLSSYHVGLALEPAKDINNNLAVSNKVMAYLQAGLFVLYTSTTGQRKLLSSFEEFTHQTPVDLHQLSEDLRWLLDNLEVVRKQSMKRLEMAEDLSWDKIKLILKNIWEKS